ncbi:PucR family transcriptional regulator [Bacillus sp. 1P06AnD]|uniref:PucR family transcriptional regulator n=1 Tax=Bacillus sp. 1P06AnD TaxID=3132208 RepID=UPI0039A058BA
MTHLTYDRLMTIRPFYEGIILAGWQGRKNICRHAAMSDTINEAKTAFIINYTPVTTNRIEKALNDPSVSAIILAAEIMLPLPAPLIQLADEKAKPLIAVSANAHTILARIHHILSVYRYGHSETLSLELSSYWLRLYNEFNIKALFKRLNHLMDQEVWLYITGKGAPSILPPAMTEKRLNDAAKSKSSSLPEKIEIWTIDDMELFAYSIAECDSEKCRYLLFETQDHSQPDPVKILLLETARLTISTWLKLEERAWDIHLKYKDQFLFDILNNNIENELDLISSASRLDMHFSPYACVMAIHLSGEFKGKDFLEEISSTLQMKQNKQLNIYTTILNQRIIALLFPEPGYPLDKAKVNEWLEDWQEVLHRHYPAIRSFIGIGRQYESNLDLHKSCQEAKMALLMLDTMSESRSFIHYEDLGFIRLLSYLHDELLSDFAQQYIGLLEQYDAENDTDLVSTLYLYCTQNGDIFQTAKRMFIHPNTLRQRLKKIESILQIQLNHFTDLVNIILALHIRHQKNGH